MNSFFSALLKSKLIIFITSVITIVFGFATYNSIPKEMFPYIKLPTVNVTVILAGVSPEDSEKLIILPLEKRFHSMDNVKKVTSFAMTGMANITVQFNQSVEPSKATQEVRNKVQEGRADMPQDILEPIISEVDFSKIPVLSVALINENSERELYHDAKYFKKMLEMIPGIVEVNAIGLRDEIVECEIDPAKWSTYNVQLNKLMQMLSANNTLISLGNLSNNSDYAVKLSGLFKNEKEVGDMPISFDGKSVIKLKDISKIKLTLEEQTRFGRVNFKPSVILQVSKKAGTNTIHIIEKVKEEIAKNQSYINKNTEISLMRDSSNKVKTSLHDLINNIIFAVILVMIVIIIQIGIRQGVVVGLSIPLSFYSGIIVLSLMGYTANIVVLFALIMVIGMIVDATIIVTEDADWRMHRGTEPVKAYMEAAQRMSIPVLSATVGIIVVFMPLLFWPGVVGQFIKFIPITLIIVLTASIIIAMIFVPVIGGAFCAKFGFKDNLKPDGFILSSRDWIESISEAYIRKLDKILDRPKRVPYILCITFVGTIFIYSFLGYGTEFFPQLEPEVIEVQIRAQGNISPKEKLRITKKAEDIIRKYTPEMKSVYSNVNPKIMTIQETNDLVAIIQLEYKDWEERRSSKVIVDNLRKDLSVMEGVSINILPEKQGPAAGKYDIELNVSYENAQRLTEALQKIESYLSQDKDYSDILDTEASGRAEWNMSFNRELALREGVVLNQIGGTMRMLTVGVPIGKVTLDSSDDKIDVVVKYPESYRSITNLQDIMVNTEYGKPVAIGNLVKTKLTKEVSKINRLDYDRVVVVGANVKTGVVANNKVAEIEKWIAQNDFGKDIKISIAGDKDDQIETGNFLKNAFSIAILIKAIILIVQFNSIYYTLVVLSAVVLSIIGVLWGLIIAGKSFCIVMCGLGIVALAGIVVSNNIILIDTYQRFIHEGMAVKEAILQSCRRRIRPILLTSATTTIGLIPMVFNINIDFLHLNFSIGSPSGLWWEHLSITIASGLVLTTFLTLIFTPCLLMIHTPETKDYKS